MKYNLKAKDVTQAVKSAAKAVIMAQAYAETMREAVDKIHRQILTEAPLPVKDEWQERLGEVITDPRNVYLCDDKALLDDYFAECNKRTRAAGLKPHDMPDTHCPALVAEELHRNAVEVLIDAGAEMMQVGMSGKEFHHRLLCAGIETEREFVDLLCKIVVNLPDFRNPLTGTAA